jgi:hypothetical protein
VAPGYKGGFMVLDFDNDNSDAFNIGSKVFDIFAESKLEPTEAINIIDALRGMVISDYVRQNKLNRDEAMSLVDSVNDAFIQAFLHVNESAGRL